jgi:hypothetical protein
MTRPLFLLLFLLSPLRSETVNVEYIVSEKTTYNGSGVIFSPDLCITAGHIVMFKKNEPIIIKREKKAINGTVLFVDEGADLAIIKMERKLDVPTLTISEGVELDEEVLVECFSRTRKLKFYSTGTENINNT